MGFEELQKQAAPPWLKDADSQKFVGFSGTQKDLEFATLKEGIKARWPTIGPDDALARQGADSDLERFAAETDATYRARILARWETHRFGGTEKGIVDSLHAYGVTDVEVYEDWEGTFADGDWYSRIWIALGPTLPWLPLTIPFTLGGETTLGSTATADEIHAVKRQIQKWGSGHDYPVAVLLNFSDVALLGVDTTLEFTLGGTVTRWAIGKLMADTLLTMPFDLGGYYED